MTRGARAARVAIAAFGLAALAGCASTRSAAGPTPGGGAPSRGAADPQAAFQTAAAARLHEERGDYAAALGEWGKLRAGTRPDADLELATALDEARAGQIEAAAARLAGPLLAAAGLDTLPYDRYRAYPAARESLYLNGAFDGWHWYVWRARAEVAATRGRWDEAATAARQCVAARPLSAADWLLLAVSAGRAGSADEARRATARAVALDRGLPEALYLESLWAWKDGRRTDAQAGFRAALGMDSTFHAAMVALVRCGLPGASPEELPTEVLTGPRAVGMLTSAAGPKIDDPTKRQRPTRLMNVIGPQLPREMIRRMASPYIRFSLYVDREGRVILAELPWYPPDLYPAPVIAELVAVLHLWRFEPRPPEDGVRGVWVELSHTFQR